MFCQKCNGPVEDGQTLCSQCAAEQAEALQQEARVQKEEITEKESDVLFDLNTPDSVETKAPPKKKRGGLIAAIVALFAVVACAVGIFLNIDAIKNFANRNLQSPEEYFVDVESAAIANLSEGLIDGYGQWAGQFDEDYSSAEMELHLTLGDTLISLLETTMQQSGGTAFELDWLSRIKLSLGSNIQSDAAQIDLRVGLGDQDLVSADAILDIEGNKVYAMIPEVDSDYVSFDLSPYVSADELKEILSASEEVAAAQREILPSEEVLEELINSYAKTVLSGVKNVEKLTETVTVNEISQEMVVLKATITKSEAMDIAEAVLTKAQSDEELENVIKAFSDYVNDMAEKSGEIAEPVDMYQEFLDGISAALDDISDEKENADSSNYIVLKAYVDAENNVRGHELSVYEEGVREDDPFTWMTVVEGNETYLQAELGEASITGEVTMEGDASSGFYALSVEGDKIGTLKFTDVCENSGTLRLIPSEKILDDMLAESAVPAALLADNVSIELAYGTDESAKSSYRLKVLLGEKELIGLAVAAEQTTGGSITIPTEAQNLANEEDLLGWLQGANFDGVLESLKKADVPGDIVDALSFLILMYQSGLA